jgi:methylmalonyl-CoA mutase C-terminal domain/subunit
MGESIWHVTREDGLRAIRCLVVGSKLSDTDNEARNVARFFRNAGFEVVYSDSHSEAEGIVRASVQEDVDVVGMSFGRVPTAS